MPPSMVLLTLMPDIERLYLNLRNGMMILVRIELWLSIFVLTPWLSVIVTEGNTMSTKSIHRFLMVERKSFMCLSEMLGMTLAFLKCPLTYSI
ncbi:hypothetical protein RRG08_043896 [Elysia crispata]|uniref:Uncharacterized protein n=1 Tax=Elysia crispata TaxID=231223 RepID=A0AAE1AYI9_9GAST|nr:hypothetical protein RRG08_043896 [Elysia crispata]